MTRRIAGSWIVLPALVLGLGFGVGLALTELLASGDGGGGAGAPTAPAPAAGTPAPKAGRSFLARVVPPPGGTLSGARPPARIARLVRSLPVEQKVAGLMLVGFSGRDATAPVFRRLPRRTYGGLMLDRSNFQSAGQLRALNAALRAAADRARRPRPFLGAVQQGGEWNALPALPPDRAPADTANVTQAVTLARTTARAWRRFGMNMIWDPSLEVGPADGGAMGSRAFSDEPDQVAAYGQSWVQELGDGRVLAAAGRFPGLGAAAVAPEQGQPNVGLSLDELRKRDLVPFRAAVRAGVPAIVVGHGLYATDDFVVPASLSHAVSSDLLRGALGFRGVAIADDLTLPAITTTMAVPDAALRSLLAGIDMVYVSGPDVLVDQTYDALLAAARSGELPGRRIDEALTRVLVAKSDLGLLRRG
jgi:beta-N-acetylhexosaminidase